MARFVSGSNVSLAWLAAMQDLLEGGGEAVNLAVQIRDPLVEDHGIRRVLDAFVAEHRPRGRRAIEQVSTVANTLFPEAWYVDRLGEAAEAHLYELEATARPVSRRRNPWGTYFERLVAWPGPGGTFNQLDQAVQRLRATRQRGHRRGNAYELGVTTPADEAVAVPVFVGGRDRQIYEFPCLSHLSLTLQAGELHLAAMYRSHEFLRRAYGNYLGLGRLLRFVARQSGWPIGEVLCVSAAATAEIGHRAGFGRGALTALVASCHDAAMTAP